MSENIDPQVEERDTEETPEPPTEYDDGVREIKPIVWLEDPDIEENLFDFRPVNLIDVEEEIVAPKASPVVEPVGSSASDQGDPVTPVPAEKDSGQPKVSGSGTPTS